MRKTVILTKKKKKEKRNGHQDGSEGKGSSTYLDYLSSISGIPMLKGVKRFQQGVL